MPPTLRGSSDSVAVSVGRHDGSVPPVREILIGQRAGDHVLLAIRGRLYPAGDDADWLWASLTVRVGGFGCQIEGDVRAEALAAFRVAVEGLHSGGVVEGGLGVEDDWLSIRMALGDDKTVAPTIVVRDQATPPNELRCTLPELSQESLVAVIESLVEVERAYPASEN